MLIELHVRDFAIIDEVTLRLEPGLNVLTGETGAGKSILVDAVAVLVGGRADVEMIRAGAERALIEGLFQVDAAVGALLAPILEQHGLLEAEPPGEVVLSREIRPGGRHVARVNGRLVPLHVLREIGQILVDIHGQTEHLSLLRPREQLELLDRYAGVGELRAALAERVARWRAVRREIEQLRQDEREKVRRMDLLRFQIEEIEAARLREGEEEALLQERNRLANAEQLAHLADALYRALYEGEEEAPSALDRLSEAARSLQALARIDPLFQPYIETIGSLIAQVEDLAHMVRDYREGIEFNPRRLAQIEERLDLIRRLQRKYGDTIPEILAYARRAKQELETLAHAEERLTALEEEAESLLREIGELGLRLSRQRQEAAERLAREVEAQLADLRMAGARFAVALERVPDPEGAYADGTRWAFDATGLDRVTFLIAPNIGEGLRPLARIASGGETSRLMLALKVALAQADPVPTLIFDEIDQGIGGRVGAVVGEKLWRLARHHQVLCVTHLPQLAGFGDTHFKVEKHVIGDRTVARVARVEGEERVAELAQMLGGTGRAAVQSAREILEYVARVKTGETARSASRRR
ncbi:DNA repair protein RecN [Thermoflexus sp.]|uniref:DNA repair protein RecN n=1 Tax=Thermoflexus sp. TaxID=1969742 RepID=UPI00177914D5|nr:DNA repair protein RecN [Thermoflexus sp.]